MEIIGTVTSKGQITIPRDLREEMGLHPGDQVTFTIDREQKLMLRKNTETPSCAGLLKRYGKGVTLTEADIQRAIEQGMAEDNA